VTDHDERCSRWCWRKWNLLCFIPCGKRLQVTVYESKTPFSETSSKSSKLLHGGMRYLESFQIKLVKEALADRAW
jgi:hypothetical protein